MSKYLIILILAIAVISKGQQQASVHQQQFNNLLAQSNKQNPSIQIHQQQVRENDPINLASHINEHITFPSHDEDLVNERQPPATNVNYNLLLQNVEQRFSTQNPDNYIKRTTVVATANNNANQYNDDQYEYIREFSWKLFQGSKIPSPIGNLILSPIQPQLQLSLLRTAATGNTEEEISSAIRESNPVATKELLGRLRTSNSVSTNIGIASAVFPANDLKLNNTFLREANERDIDIIRVNFNSAEESGFVINNWVANATNNKIRHIFKADVNRGIRTLLVNTIYFNGEWKYGFNEVHTEPFQTTERLVKNVDMMKNIASLRSGKMTLRSGFTGEWVELPYRGDEFSMVIILPQQRHYLDEFIRTMRTVDFDEILKQLNNPYKKLVHLSLPKFNAASSFSLVNVLLKMGVVDLFSRLSSLPNLALNEPSLHVDDILQQAILSVDEKGTIAAAATISHVVTLSLNSAPEEIFFTVDQPFLSIVVDKRNRVPLFISKIYDP